MFRVMLERYDRGVRLAVGSPAAGVGFMIVVLGRGACSSVEAGRSLPPLWAGRVDEHGMVLWVLCLWRVGFALARLKGEGIDFEARCAECGADLDGDAANGLYEEMRIDF